ncbi:transposase [Ralstonia solanacearum]|nr:transposase [Ralstonia solanacearum]NKA78171.1 transposase [Ralstonia solanacearum]NKG01218.1 transposase [Ralstonia solanacearum]NKG06100.1 transposase [Ralstonia solanacearum]
MERTYQRRFPLTLDARPVRTVVTRSGSMPRGYFPSLKNGRMVEYEQTLEADACLLFEMSPLIQAYRQQPEKIWFPDGDRTRLYRPDYELELFNGKRVLVEIKPAKRLAKPDIRAKFDRIQEHMDRTERQFVILTEESVRQQPRLDNLRTLRRDMPSRDVEQGHIRTSLRKIIQSGATTLGEVTTLVGQSTTFALLTQGYAACSLDQRFTTNTSITLCLEPRHDWFFLTQGRGF